jgi:hypothetical protein
MMVVSWVPELYSSHKEQILTTEYRGFIELCVYYIQALAGWLAGRCKSDQPSPGNNNPDKMRPSALVSVLKNYPDLRLQPNVSETWTPQDSEITPKLGKGKWLVRPRRNTPGPHWFMKMAVVDITFLSGGRLTFWHAIDFSRNLPGV